MNEPENTDATPETDDAEGHRLGHVIEEADSAVEGHGVRTGHVDSAGDGTDGDDVEGHRIKLI